MGIINSRSKDIVNNLNEYTFHILGCGAIGSSVAIQLCKMGAEYFYLYDMDKVEELNIGVSAYNLNDIGQHKTNALLSHLKDNNPLADVRLVKGRFKELMYQESKDIVILGFDNMKARMQVVDFCVDNKCDVMLIDGRMGAEQYQQYTFPKLAKNKYLRYWYSDEEGSEDPCNAKATSYCSNMAGSFIANTVRKLVTGQVYEEKIEFYFPNMGLDTKQKNSKLVSR